jgi:hypothetical protein
MLWALVIVLLWQPGQVHAQLWSGILDPSRAVDWGAGYAGVPGGIPTRTTVCDTIAPYTGTAATINNALAACPAGQVVKLDSGTFTLSTGITFNGVSNVTLRGNGGDATKLVFSGGDNCFGSPSAKAICVRGSSGTFAEIATNIGDWTAGFAAGSTDITLSSVSGLAVGQIIVLDQCNDGRTTDACTGTESDPGTIFNCAEINICSIQGPTTGDARMNVRMQQHMAEITAINGSVLTISPPIYMPNWRSGQAPKAWTIGSAAATAKGNGIEDLSLDYIGPHAGNAGIIFANAWGNWVKGVRGLGPAARAHVWFYQSGRNEVRDSYFYGSGGASTSYGVDTFQGHSNLTVNNIFHHVVSPLLPNMGAGNVWAYNYAFDMSREDFPTLAGGVWNVHSGGVGMILVEGNQGDGAFRADTIHGSSSMVTAFRNQFPGTNGTLVTCSQPATIQSFHRYYNVIGNVLGLSGYHDTYEVLAPNSDYESIFNLNHHNPCGVSEVPPDDTLVKTTMMRWGNYDVVNAANRFESSEVPSGLSLYANAVPGSQSLPASFYYTAKPSSWWGTPWGNPPWPAVGPDVTGGNVTGYGGRVWKNPARLCYENLAQDGANLYKTFNATTCYTPQQDHPMGVYLRLLWPSIWVGVLGVLLLIRLLQLREARFRTPHHQGAARRDA